MEEWVAELGLAVSAALRIGNNWDSGLSTDLFPIEKVLRSRWTMPQAPDLYDPALTELECISENTAFKLSL